MIDPSKNQIENFEGDLSVGGSAIFRYSWDKNGEIEVTMTSIAPTPANGPIALYIGQTDSAGNCFQLAGYAAQAIVNRKVQFGLLEQRQLLSGRFRPRRPDRPDAFPGTFSHP